MKKKVLITGVLGFVGRSLETYIKRERPSFRVFGIDARAGISRRGVIACDLRNKTRLKNILLKVRPDIIFHLAGGRSDLKKKLRQENLVTTKALFDVVSGIEGYRPRIVIAGSAAEYGAVARDGKPVDETYAGRPVSLYGAVKFAQTQMSLACVKQGMDVVVARVFNVFGAGTPPTLVAGNFAQVIMAIKAKKAPKVIRTKNLSGERDFLDIDEVCRSLVLVAERGKTGEIYNICSGEAVSIRKLLRGMLKVAHVRDVVVREEKKKDSRSCSFIGSHKKFRQLSDWVPRLKLDESLRKTLASYHDPK